MTGTSSFSDFLASQAPDLLPSRRGLPPGEAGDLAPHGTTIVAATFPGGVVVAGDRRHVFFDGRSYAVVNVDRLHTGGAGEDAHGGLVAPMPGKVIAWLAQPGTTVEKGAPLLVLEAMKMEHTIVAPKAGLVKSFRFNPGEQVSDGAELVEFEASA
jgi:biotin carboxyl carrier protein